MLYRIPDPANWPHGHVDRIIRGDALEALSELSDECVALVTVVRLIFSDLQPWGVGERR